MAQLLRQSAAGLTAAEVYGTLVSLPQDMKRFSPCWGLVALSTPSLLYNLLTCPPSLTVSDWGVAASADVAKEMFVVVGPNAVRPTTSLSKPAYHLSAVSLGHLIGLAAQQSSTASVTSVLKDSYHIVSNKVKGEWTGVSLARYLRLYGFLADALRHDSEPAALAVASRFVWERANGRADLVDFMVGVSRGVGRATPFNDAWDSERFLAATSTPEGIAFAAQVKSTSVPVNLADDAVVELIAAKLSRAFAFKPPVKMRKHTPADAIDKATKPVTDCVEVAVREVCEFVAVDVIAAQGLGELCHGPLPVLLCQAGLLDPTLLVAAWNAENISPRVPISELQPLDGVLVSQRWFDTLQRLGRQHSARFLSRDGEHGRPYELWPSTANVALLVACMLDPCAAGGPTSWKGTFDTLSNRWQYRINTEQRRFRTPGATSDHRTREVVTLHSPTQQVYLEIEFEVLHHIARVTHTAPPLPWGQLKDKIAKEPPGFPMSWMIEAAVAPDRRVEAAAKLRGPGPWTAKEALQGTMWSRRRIASDVWRPLESNMHVAEGDYQQNRDELKAAGARSVGALLLLNAVTDASAVAPLAEWIGKDAPLEGFTDEYALGNACRRYPADVVERLAQHRGTALVKGEVSIADIARSPTLAFKMAFSGGGR